MKTGCVLNNKPSWLALLTVMLLLPAVAQANPIGIDETIILPFLLEALFFAIVLRPFGFRSLFILPVWFVVTMVTWLSFIGLPLGSQLATLAGNVAVGGYSELGVFTFMVIGAELLICLTEAVIVLLAGKLWLIRNSQQARLEPIFSIIFKLAILGNIVSLFAGMTISIESPAGWLLYLVIIPAIWFALYLVRKCQTTVAEKGPPHVR